MPFSTFTVAITVGSVLPIFKGVLIFSGALIEVVFGGGW
jgi:hypothetical protein